ncbi:MAG: YihA family ribosome biogenesis GTP-binding protein [Candidatus Taylorbacteria bacterium]|nr:YihA family ribosome biogenesis GTP-binding protein [Candidatus Taylorbacteria bacterium]
MKISSAEFIKGIRGTDPILADGVPQVAFIGRSNVGKSSLINALVNRKELVKTGKKPGKTTEINFFSINKSACYFVDLPGYGYAKADPEEKEKIRKLILWYVQYSEVRPLCLVLILDVKAGLTDFDKGMLFALRECKHRYIIVANKMDKLNQKELAIQLTSIRNESGEQSIFACSAETKDGIDVLRAQIFS